MKKKLLFCLLCLSLCSCHNQSKDIQEIKQIYETQYYQYSDCELELINVSFLGKAEYTKNGKTIIEYHYKYDLIIHYPDGYMEYLLNQTMFVVK